MNYQSRAEIYSYFLTIVTWGAIWGIFEATVGYALHAVSFGYSWLVWYPAVCFFMMSVYHRTKSVSSIVLVGVICSAVKLLNLFLPGRIDKVINPAVSILFEALTMAGALYIATRFTQVDWRSLPYRALTVLCMNTAWRLLFAVYLLLLVPDWIREISVISSTQKLMPFFITQNIITSIVIFIGMQLQSHFSKQQASIEGWFDLKLRSLSSPIYRSLLVAFMLGLNVFLQFV